MDWKPTLIRKAAKVRDEVCRTYWGALLLAGVIIWEITDEGYVRALPPEGKLCVWLTGGIILSALLVAQADCMLRPEESARGIRQAKIRHWIFLTVWAGILAIAIWKKPFFFLIFPGLALLLYAYGFHAMHNAFNLVEHPHAPKSILLGLPIENILNRYSIVFRTGLLSAALFLLMLLISHFAATEIFRKGTLLAGCIFLLSAVWLLVPIAAVRLGATQRFQKWLWLALRLIPISKSASEPAQFDLFVWCLANPGKTDPPKDLLEKVYADRKRLRLPGAVSEKAEEPLPELVIGSESDSLSPHCKDTPPLAK